MCCMATEPEEDWPRLAAQIEHRLDDLTLQWKDIALRGGPSPAKVRELRNGRSQTLSRSKRRDLERALEWEHGSVDWVLAGREPRSLPRTNGSSTAPLDVGRLRDLSTDALWKLQMEVSAVIRSRVRDDVQDWQEGWSPGKSEDPGVGLHEDGE